LCSNKPRFIDVKLEPMKIRRQIEIKKNWGVGLSFLENGGRYKKSVGILQTGKCSVEFNGKHAYT